MNQLVISQDSMKIITSLKAITEPSELISSVIIIDTLDNDLVAVAMDKYRMAVARQLGIVTFFEDKLVDIKVVLTPEIISWIETEMKTYTSIELNWVITIGDKFTILSPHGHEYSWYKSDIRFPDWKRMYVSNVENRYSGGQPFYNTKLLSDIQVIAKKAYKSKKVKDADIKVRLLRYHEREASLFQISSIGTSVIDYLLMPMLVSK